MNCSVCGKSDDLECPACDKAFCVSCFVDHGKACYHSQKKTEQGEQKKCSNCKQTGSEKNPVVVCRDCQRELCRSCFSIHFRAHEAEKNKSANFKYCVECNLGKLASVFYECPACHSPVCIDCNVVHNQKHQQKRTKACVSCWNPTTTECDECHKPYCFPCFAKHRAVHEQQAQTWHWCAGCNRAKQQDANKSDSPYWQCPTCHEYYCEVCTMRHTHVYARANFAGRFNVDDFKINSDIINETIKQAKETAERIRQEQEAKQKKQEEEARRRKEEEFQREKARLNEEFFRRFFGGSYASFSSSSTELQQAFSVLQLSTRATVQEVKHAFKRKAKEAHPDVGGSEEAFKKLNNAYELALAHAKRNER